MPGRKSIREQWEEFSLAVGLYNTPEIQRREMRKAFYAGAISIFEALMSGLEEDHEPTQADMDYMTSINNELARFEQDLKAGRA